MAGSMISVPFMKNMRLEKKSLVIGMGIFAGLLLIPITSKFILPILADGRDKVASMLPGGGNA